MPAKMTESQWKRHQQAAKKQQQQARPRGAKKPKPVKLPPAPLERDVMRDVLAYLARCGVIAWRANSGSVPSQGGGLVRLAPAGTADVIGCLPGAPLAGPGVPAGRMLAVELKRPGKGDDLRPAQAEWQGRLRRAGALVLVATSCRDVCLALRGAGYLVPDPDPRML